MNGGDAIARCLLANGSVRVITVVATDAVREAARRHDATAAASVALGRAGMAGLLLATLTKGDEHVTLQILGNGPFGTITVDATAAGTMRAFMKNADVELPIARPRPTLASAVGRTGIVSVIRDLGMREDFSGQTEFAEGEIDTDVEKYLTNSEQIASALACEVVVDPQGEVQVAAGVLVQALPESEGAELTAAIRRSLRAGALTRLLGGDGAGGDGGAGDVQGPLSADELARRVLAGAQIPELGAEEGQRLDLELDLDVLEVRSVRFHCPCSRERAATALALLGDAELADLIREDGQAEVTCNFCRERYEFSDVELEQIRRSARQGDVPPS